MENLRKKDNLLYKIANYLKSINITTGIMIVIGGLTLFVPILYRHQDSEKAKKGLVFHIGEYPLDQQYVVSIIYLCPTSLIQKSELKATLPLSIKSEYENVVDNVVVLLASGLTPINDIQAINPITNKPLQTEKRYDSSKLRFKNDSIKNHNAKPINREWYPDRQTESEYIKYDIEYLVPNVIYNLKEILRLDTLAFFHEKLGSSMAAKDHFAIDLEASFRDIEDRVKLHLMINLYNYDNIDEFFENEYNENGRVSNETYLFDLINNTKIIPQRHIVIVPSITKNDSFFNISTNDIIVYQFEYKAKNYRTNRKILMYDGDNNIIKTINFPDLSKEKAEFAKKLAEQQIQVPK